MPSPREGSVAQNASRDVNRVPRITVHGVDMDTQLRNLVIGDGKALALLNQQIGSIAASSISVGILKSFEEYNRNLAKAFAPFRAWQIELARTTNPIVQAVQDLAKTFAWVGHWDPRDRPTNWPPGLDTRKRLEFLSRKHSVALYGFPSREHVAAIVACSSIKEVDLYLTSNAEAIGDDLLKNVTTKKYKARLKRPLVEIAASLKAGNIMAAQSLSMAVAEEMRSVLTRKQKSEFKKDIAALTVDLVPHDHYGWGYVIESLKGVMVDQRESRKTEPRRLNRNSIAHSIDGHQYTPKNAVRAAFLAFSLVEVWAKSPKELKDILAATAGLENPFNIEYARSKRRQDAKLSKSSVEKDRRKLEAAQNKSRKNAQRGFSNPKK